MKINTLGDWARYFLLFWGIPVGFKSDRLNHSHEGSEHTRSGTKLAYSWSQRCRTKSQQFETHIGTPPPLKLKIVIYTFYEQKWDFMAVIAVLRGTWIFQQRCRTSTELMKQSTTSAHVRASVALHSRTLAGSIMDILIIKSQSYRIIMWSKVLKWQILW